MQRRPIVVIDVSIMCAKWFQDWHVECSSWFFLKNLHVQVYHMEHYCQDTCAQLVTNWKTWTTISLKNKTQEWRICFKFCWEVSFCLLSNILQRILVWRRGNVFFKIYFLVVVVWFPLVWAPHTSYCLCS